MHKYLKEDLNALRMVIGSIDKALLSSFAQFTTQLIATLKQGKKLMVCGNGGSAADAEHLAGELVGRFGYDRPSLPCISLCTPSATFTAISNDYGYENAFARQVQGLGNEGDILLGISTSGNSENIVKAFEMADSKGILKVAMTGSKASKLSEYADICIKAPSALTPRIQEIHGIIIHSLCRAIEVEIFPKSDLTLALDSDKLINKEKIVNFANSIKGYKTVFTNGCFDIVHPGHIKLLKEARSFGDFLIVGLNTDSSVKRLKGDSRPWHNFEARAEILSALECVDYVIGFEEDTPEALIKTLTPKVLVKGSDYSPDNIVGADWVKKHGGETKVVNLLEGHSTSRIIKNHEN